MKTKFLSVTLTLFVYSQFSFSQINMTTNGFVKIGSTANPTKTLDVAGNVIVIPGTQGNLIIDNSGYYYSAGIYPSSNGAGSVGISTKAFKEIWYYDNHQLSDSRQKENFRDIQSPLSLILKLKGLEYDIKKEFTMQFDNNLSQNQKERADADRKNKLGFIAQDVQKVLPQVVYYDDTADVYSMDYSKIIPVIVEAMKEQQSQIDSLKKLLSKSTLKSSKALEVTSVTNYNNAELSQNVPNPFSQSTSINYYLPENNQKASIYIYDMNGTQLKCYPLHLKGSGNVTINGNELKAGMYIYSLIVDGQLIDTKRMILTD